MRLVGHIKKIKYKKKKATGNEKKKKKSHSQVPLDH